MQGNDSLPVLIIPSAKYVPEELRFLGKIPAIVYPINQKIVFDYINELYSDKCSSIQIACYEGMALIERRLSPYLQYGVHLRRLPELRDLGYSVYCLIKDVTDPIIINYADTIVFDKLPKEQDFIFYAEDYQSESWTFFAEEDGRICELRDKISPEKSTIEKMFVGLFGLSDTQCFVKCLEYAFSEPEENTGSFYQALSIYSESHKIVFKKVYDWFDIGHIEKYYNSMLEVKAREFNHISIDKNRGILRKTSDNKDKLIDEIKWYLKLPRDIEYISPRLFSYSLSYADPYLSMEYYSYHTVHELFLYSDFDRQQWVDIFSRILFVYKDLNKHKITGCDFYRSLEDMYLNKTVQRLESVRDIKCFECFFENSVTVNGVTYKSLEGVLALLEKEIPLRLLDLDSFSIIHGDLCFSNILIDTNLSFVKLLDPRGRFGEMDIYGDPRYDLAKLMHSVDGKYDYIIKDLFTLTFDKDVPRIDFEIQNKSYEFDMYELFTSVFSDELGSCIEEVELIEALLFLSMIPLHSENFRHQLVMLATAYELLDRMFELREN